MLFKNYLILICLLFILNDGVADENLVEFFGTESTGVSDAKLARISFNEMVDRGKILIKSLPKFTIKLAGSVKQLLPSAEMIFNVSKQVLVGLPQEVIAYAVHTVCSAAIHVNAIRPLFVPHVRDMNFELLTPSSENISIPLVKPKALWMHPKFRKDWNTVLLITGWNTDINSSNEAVDVLYSAYANRNTNFVVRMIHSLL